MKTFIWTRTYKKEKNTIFVILNNSRRQREERLKEFGWVNHLIMKLRPDNIRVLSYLWSFGQMTGILGKHTSVFTAWSNTSIFFPEMLNKYESLICPNSEFHWKLKFWRKRGKDRNLWNVRNWKTVYYVENGNIFIENERPRTVLILEKRN